MIDLQKKSTNKTNAKNSLLTLWSATLTNSTYEVHLRAHLRSFCIWQTKVAVPSSFFLNTRNDKRGESSVALTSIFKEETIDSFCSERFPARLVVFLHRFGTTSLTWLWFFISRKWTLTFYAWQCSWRHCQSIIYN